jgi:hypothetical protein
LSGYSYNANLDLGAGNDTVNLSNTGNTVTIFNIETLTAGAGDDLVTVGQAVAGGKIDLGVGNDQLTLAAGGDTLTVSGVETLVGGAGNDSITLGNTLFPVGGTVDLGGGNDKLTLGNGGSNVVTVLNVETVVGGNSGNAVVFGTAAPVTYIGGSGGDTISIGSATGADVISLGGGAGQDTIVFTSASQSAPGTADTISGFDPSHDKLFFQGMLNGGSYPVTVHTGTFTSFTSNGSTGPQEFFDTSTHVLHVDVNGSGTDAMQITLTGVNGAALSASNFVWT